MAVEKLCTTATPQTWDALPDELLSAVLLQGANLHVRTACARARAVYDAAVAEREEAAWLVGHLEALRVTLPQPVMRARWMLRKHHNVNDLSCVPQLTCARCGARTAGILTCGCHHQDQDHHHQARCFPWERVLLGPSLASAGLVLLACLIRHR